MKRRAFTLVELLVAMMIIGILASMVLFAMAAAEESAKQAKTKSTITKLHNLLMPKYESYRTRRAPVNFVPPAGTPPLPPRDAARVRLDALRELQRMEMPDRFSDIIDGPITPASAFLATPKMARPSVSSSYLAQLTSIGTETTENQGAECLYMIVTRGLDEPDALEQFSTSEIGDTDKDGLREFVDGWGLPISFLRWAPGFVSPLQLSPPTSHDPFDPLKVYANTFPLFPLIVSAGPDGALEHNTGGTVSNMHNYAAVNNDPYAASTTGLVGSPTDFNGDGKDGTLDNLTNHDIGAK